MVTLETLRIAVGGLLANKLRSGLTILGLTIGVASVIVLISVGTGSSKAVQARIQSLGTNVLIVMPSFSRGGLTSSTSTPATLTVADADALVNPVHRSGGQERLARRQRLLGHVHLRSDDATRPPRSWAPPLPTSTAHDYTIAAGRASPTPTSRTAAAW